MLAASLRLGLKIFQSKSAFPPSSFPLRLLHSVCGLALSALPTAATPRFPLLPSASTPHHQLDAASDLSPPRSEMLTGSAPERGPFVSCQLMDTTSHFPLAEGALLRSGETGLQMWPWQPPLMLPRLLPSLFGVITSQIHV